MCAKKLGTTSAMQLWKNNQLLKTVLLNPATVTPATKWAMLSALQEQDKEIF